MEDLKQGQIRVHLKGGSNYISPEINKANIVRCVADIDRIEHYKAPPPPPPPKPAAPPVPVRSKATLLGKLLKDNKILLPELIEWIEESKSIEDIGLVMKGETRAGAKKAAQERIIELL